MNEFLMILFRGVGLGAIYALIALSFNVVSRSSGILNFAQGNILVLSGLLTFRFFPSAPSPADWFMLLPLITLATAAFVGVQGAITLLPLRSSVEQHSWLITTMAVSVSITAIMLLTQGPYALSVQSPFQPLNIFGVRTPFGYVASVALLAFWVIALTLFYSKTTIGLSMSALSQDLDAARAAGIPVFWIQVLSFVVSGAIAGSAGFVGAAVLEISPTSGTVYLVNGFIAAIVGGLGSSIGAIVGGFAVGISAMFAAYHFGGQYQNALAFSVLILVLMIRPEGLFTRTSVRRV